MGRNWRGWSDVNIYADLFLTFAKIGVCTFGGGYAMLPILQRELVEKRGWATEEEMDLICRYSLKINDVLTAYLKDLNIELIDFKLEFGKTSDGTIVLADEISPDTCRFWDSVTHEKLDKDRFRRDLGGVEDAYHEIMKRLMGE